MNLIKEKIKQAVSVLNETGVDMWLTFVRESATVTDPAIEVIAGHHVTWQTAWIITRRGETIVIAGSLDVAAIKDLGLYDEIIGYVQGIGSDLRSVFARLDPQSIAINYSTDTVTADGLTHGMYLQLLDYLKGTPYAKRLISSEPVLHALRGRKTAEEIRRMKNAIRVALEIFDKVTGFLRPGKTERDVANFIMKQVKAYGVTTAWDPDHCPAVFSGPEHAGAHYAPTQRKIEGGHVLNIDFGVKADGYCSDLQRTWYIRRKGEAEPPKEVVKGFNVIRDSISRAVKALKPGAISWQVDDVARSYITNAGYAEYPHALGHQIGRAAHDGGIGLYPRWERYGALPNGIVETGQVFTVEPRLPIEGYGVATVEEMVQVTATGAKFLSERQKELWVV